MSASGQNRGVGHVRSSPKSGRQSHAPACLPIAALVAQTRVSMMLGDDWLAIHVFRGDPAFLERVAFDPALLPLFAG